MLKYKEIIDKLNTRQKLLMLTDLTMLSNAEINAHGVPNVTFSDLESLNKEGEQNVVFANYSSAINSFNPNLIYDSMRQVAIKGKSSGVDLIVAPQANLKTNIYSKNATEDPILSGLMLSKVTCAINEVGATSAVKDVSLSNFDVELAEIKPNARAIREYYLKPFKVVNEKGENNVYITNHNALMGEYQNVNLNQVDKFIKSDLRSDKYVICTKVDETKALSAFEEGVTICLDGAFNALDNAYKKYVEYKLSVENGGASFTMLDEEKKKGTLITEDQLNEYVDRVIDFAHYCKEQKGYAIGAFQEDTAKQLSLELCEQSIVLLKNENKILPLNSKIKVAVVGDLAYSYNPKVIGFSEFLADNSNDFEFVGSAHGYKLYDDRSDELIPIALETAKNADVVLCFLGFDNELEGKAYSARSLKIPANQEAMLDALKNAGKLLVGVVASCAGIDMSFDKYLSAVLYAPLDSSESSQALYNVICGKTNPSGRLSKTLYHNTDKFFEEIKQNKFSGKNKVGSFIGYRYYDSAKMTAKYPFGYGLSYSDFLYSSLKIAKNSAKVTIKNISANDGYAVPQIYIGKLDSALVRPDKELHSFEKVFLKSGESKVVDIEFNSKFFEVYDREKSSMTIEGGIYEVYLCDNACDVKLTAKIQLNGRKLKKSKDKRIEYLPNLSNCDEMGFTLKPRSFNGSSKLKAFGLTLLFSSIGLLPLFLIMFGQGMVLGVIGSVLTFNLLIIGIILVSVNSSIAKSNMLQAQHRAEEERLRLERIGEVFTRPYDELFLDEFKYLDEQIAKEEQAKKTDVIYSEAEDISQYLDKSITFDEILRQYKIFVNERGISLDDSSARELLSAIFTSRILIFNNSQPQLNERLIAITASFFKTSAFEDKDCSNYEKTNDLLLRYNEKTYTDTQMRKAFKYAEGQRQNLVFTILNNVKAKELESYFSRVIKFASNPNAVCLIPAKGLNGAETMVTIPKNMWFAIILGEGETIYDLPKSVVDVGFVVSQELQARDRVKDRTEVNSPSFYQINAMKTSCFDKYDLGENYWKKLDKIEAYAKQRSGYYIDNRLWQKLEVFVSIYLAMGGENEILMDSMLAGKILLGMINQLNGQLSQDDDIFIHTVENVFGDDNLKYSSKIIKDSPLNNSQIN